MTKYEVTGSSEIPEAGPRSYNISDIIGKSADYIKTSQAK